MLRPTNTAKNLSKLYDLPLNEIDKVVKGVITTKPKLNQNAKEVMIMRNLDLVLEMKG
jgi:hypothetical protein